MSAIRAIYKDGVFRPLDRVDIPDDTEVTFEPVPAQPDKPNLYRGSALDKLLSRRFDGGDPRVAEKHNEHQP
jgi:hypothetical protein